MLSRSPSPPKPHGPCPPSKNDHTAECRDARCGGRGACATWHVRASARASRDVETRDESLVHLHSSYSMDERRESYSITRARFTVLRV